MSGGSADRRYSVPTLAIVVAVVLLSGCTGAFGAEEDVSLYPLNDSSTSTAASQTTASPGASAPSSTSEPATEAPSPGSEAPSPTSSAVPTETTPDSDDSGARERSGGGSSSASSGASGGSGSSSEAAGSPSAPADSSDPSSTTTTAPPATTTTPGPTTAEQPTTEPTTEANAASSQSDACDAYDEQVGPHDRAELESDGEVCVTEWDDRPSPDSFTVSGVVGNPADETIGNVDVEVILYDGDGNELARKTDSIEDLDETDRFVVEFVDVFEGAGAPEPDDGLSYRVRTTVGSTAEAPATAEAPTTTGPPAATGTPAPTEQTGETETPTATEAPAPTTTPGPTPTEPDGGVEGSVESDEYTAVTSHEIDTSGGDVVVTGTLTNPTDARIDDPHVRVVLYDDEGDEIAYGSDPATEEEPISPLYEPGESGSFEVTFPDVDPAEVASYTVRSTATDPAEDPANTRADIAVTFDRMSWLDAPLETYVEVTNQKEEPVERLDVVITAYDENGTVIAEHTERITDLGIGETVTFDHEFEVTDDEVDRVELDVPGEDYGFVQ